MDLTVSINTTGLGKDADDDSLHAINLSNDRGQCVNVIVAPRRLLCTRF